MSFTLFNLYLNDNNFFFFKLKMWPYVMFLTHFGTKTQFFSTRYNRTAQNHDLKFFISYSGNQRGPKYSKHFTPQNFGYNCVGSVA